MGDDKLHAPVNNADKYIAKSMLSRLQKNILIMRLFDDHNLVASLVDDYVRNLNDKQILERHLDLLPSFSEYYSGVYKNMPSGHQDFMCQQTS